MNVTEDSRPDKASTSAMAADDPRVVRALEEYAAAAAAGKKPNRQEFEGRYPEIAAALAECLDGLEFVQAAAPQLAHPAGRTAGRTAGRSGLAEFWPADALGDYRIVREVGRGGMGVVYEVMQLSLGRRVALKVLPFASALDAKQLQRFKNEAQAAAQLHHQNIVPVYGVGSERGVHYYAMQFIDGQTLSALIVELRFLAGMTREEPIAETFALASLAGEVVSGRWAPSSRGLRPSEDGLPRPSVPKSDHATAWEGHPPASSAETTHQTVAAASTERSTRSPAYFRTVANLGVQAAEALEHAHAAGVVHRDVKPANLLLDSRGHLWVTDFGLAHCQSQAGLTMTGDLMGTLRYMSPEQALAQRVLLDHRTDIYSLGATLYELLTLAPVFDGRDRQELLRQIAGEEPRRPRAWNDAIPSELETIVLKAMEKNPIERYATAQDLADDLGRYLKDEPIRAKRPTVVHKVRKWTRRHIAVVRTATAMLALLLVTVTVGALLAAWRLNGERDATREQLQLTQQAEIEATRRLYRSLVEQARANRLARRMGQRFTTLDILTAAATQARELQLPESDLLELRNEAVACLALTDLRVSGKTWPTPPLGGGIVACDPQGRHYACGGERNKITVYQSGGPRVVAVLAGEGPDAICVDLRFSPDGRYLAVGYRYDGRFGSRTCVWDLRRAGAPQRVLSEDADSAAFSPDSRTLALDQTKGSITVHTLAGGEVKRLEGDFRAGHMALHPGGGSLAMAAWNGWKARLIDTDTGRDLAELAHHSEIHALEFSGDGRLLAVGCEDCKVYVWDVPRRRLQAVLEGHEKQVTRLAFSPFDELLATSARDGATRLWDPVDGRQLVAAPGLLLGWRDEPGQLAFHAYERLGVWQVAHGRECRVLHHGRVGNRAAWRVGGPEGLAFHHELPMLVSADDDGARLWDAIAGRELAYLAVGHTEAALFSPDGRRLYTYGRLGLQTWPIAPDVPRPWGALRIGPPDEIAVPIGRSGFRLCASADGRLLGISSHPGGHAYVLDADQGSRQMLLEECPWVHSLALSPDGRWIAAGVVDQGIKVWRTADGALLKHFSGPRTSVTFSPDGRWLLGGGPTDYQLWRTGTWEPTELFVRERAEYWVGPATLTRDSRILALAAGLQQARLIDFATRRELATLPAEGVSCVAALAFSADGRRLAVSAENHTIRLWDLSAVRQVLRGMLLDWSPADNEGGSAPGASAPPIGVVQFNFEAELLPVFAAGCEHHSLDMFEWGREHWSNGCELYCRGAPGGYVEFEFEVGEAGRYELALLWSRGPDAGVFQVALDGQDLGGPLDGFGDRIAPVSATTMGKPRLDSGVHRLRCTLLEKNTRSRGHEMGIDAIRLTPLADDRPLRVMPTEHDER
jgi:eukaryotic-like serine/threonine-protein kinase